MAPAKSDTKDTRKGNGGDWGEGLPEQLVTLLNEAQRVRASDIHVDPVDDDRLRVCFRVDGAIHPHRELDRDAGRQLLNQIKIAAQFTPDRTFAPLESRLAWSPKGERREARVTIAPTSRDEAAHIRLLSPPENIIEPEALGLAQSSLARIREALQRAAGLILICGPTGAGKTMTLYSLAAFLSLEEMIAVSIEDPVENDLPYVRQVQVDAEHGLDMADGLRTLLRMDPDLIMIGEIRDPESALTAARAAASGRFVMATLHARDIATAVETMRFLTVPPHLLGNTLRLVIGQDLVRRVCAECAADCAPTDDEKALFEAESMDVPDRVPEANGCARCHGYGYRGRLGIFQVVAVDADMAATIAETGTANVIRREQRRQAISSLRRDGLEKVAAGLTTVREILNLHRPGGRPDDASS